MRWNAADALNLMTKARATCPAHFDVRPIGNTRTGSVPGTEDHYYWNVGGLWAGGAISS
jgi:hypothetical protein